MQIFIVLAVPAQCSLIDFYGTKGGGPIEVYGDVVCRRGQDSETRGAGCKQIPKAAAVRLGQVRICGGGGWVGSGQGGKNEIAPCPKVHISFLREISRKTGNCSLCSCCALM